MAGDSADLHRLRALFIPDEPTEKHAATTPAAPDRRLVQRDLRPPRPTSAPPLVDVSWHSRRSPTGVSPLAMGQSPAAVRALGYRGSRCTGRRRRPPGQPRAAAGGGWKCSTASRRSPPPGGRGRPDPRRAARRSVPATGPPRAGSHHGKLISAPGDVSMPVPGRSSGRPGTYQLTRYPEPAAEPPHRPNGAKAPVGRNRRVQPSFHRSGRGVVAATMQDVGTSKPSRLPSRPFAGERSSALMRRPPECSRHCRPAGSTAQPDPIVSGG